MCQNREKIKPVTSKARHFRHHRHAFVMINLSCFVVIRALSRQSLYIAYVWAAICDLRLLLW